MNGPAINLSPVTAPAKLAWKGVRKRFGATSVLADLDLSVAAGRSLVIIGGSGQGKSVTLKVALGLMEPDAGQIALDGQNVSGLSASARRKLFSRFGVLFQGAALFDSVTVWENVAFRLLNADGVGRKAARARAIDALERVRLDAKVADLFPGELSGGMQKRVGLARAVVATPEILFFDEPTTGLDPITAADINALIVEQVRRLGCTAVSITHDLASARTIGDEIALLHEGRIVWRGAPADLDATSDPRVRQFVDGRPDGPLTAQL
jgi:phospholipid/cholesterol/gamma-HCH transport system ATP-binding protein